MRGGDSETAMKSAGTTGYYQASWRSSAQASGPAGPAVGGGGQGRGRRRWGADVAGVTVKTALKCTETRDGGV